MSGSDVQNFQAKALRVISWLPQHFFPPATEWHFPDRGCFSPHPKVKSMKYEWEINIFVVGTSLVAQWLRICLPTQGTRVRAPVQEDPTCRGTTKPVRLNYGAFALEPASHNYWSPCTTTTEAHVPRDPAPQQEKPQQWEACAPQRRVAPARRN